MNYYEEKQYTDDELIVRIMDKEAIKKLRARRAFYYANNQRRRELDERWVSTREYRDSASYGRNWGYYIGMDAIRDYYVNAHNDKIAQLPGANRGDGCLFHHPISTGLVQEAFAGKTARGLWYCISQETLPTSNTEADARW